MKLTDGVLLVTTIVGPEVHLPTGASSIGFVGDVEEVGVLLEQPFPCTRRLRFLGVTASAWLPIVIFTGFGDIHEIGFWVIAENEFDTLVVPAISLSC